MLISVDFWKSMNGYAMDSGTRARICVVLVTTYFEIFHFGFVFAFYNTVIFVGA